MQYGFGNRNCTPILDIPSLSANHQSGIYFHHSLDLPQGSYTALVQSQLGPDVTDAEIRISATAGAERTQLAQTTQRVEAEGSDRILLSFTLEKAGTCEIRGWVDRDCFGTLLRYLTVVPSQIDNPDDREFHFSPDLAVGKLPEVMIIGTTSKCPASCICCPTNKPATRPVPKGVMSQAMFDDLIDDLAGIGFSGGIIFGLYGDPLMDPHLTDRLRKIKSALPTATALLATTGATYDADIHGEAIDLFDSIALHIEAMNPATYDVMMDPLKAERTFPRIRSLIERARMTTHLVMPFGRSNVMEIAPIVAYSREMKLRKPEFAALSNRCGLNATWQKESLAPVATCCSPQKVAEELIVDWDGTIVACCFDFMRHGAIASLSRMRLSEYLKSRERQEFLDRFTRKDWHGLKACRNCRVDDTTQAELLAKSMSALSADIVHLRPRDFLHAPDIESRDGALIAAGHTRAAGNRANRVWGPYYSLPRGEYSAHLRIDGLAWGYQSRLRCEIVVDEKVIAARDCLPHTADKLTLPLDFEIEADGILQVRLVTDRVDFRFEGVGIVPR